MARHSNPRNSLLITVCIVAVVVPAIAGGPLYVAGGSPFDAGVTGTPLTWAGGQISYYTDRGGLSPAFTGSAADALVAEAFSRWTSVSTAALSAARAGQLDEDVSGANVISTGTDLTMPADVQPGSAKPVAVVYDYDGQVIDALLGTGASATDLCDRNAVVGGVDRFTPEAHLVHALLVINGNCAQSSAAQPALRYQLVRAVGRVLGLDWSQVNDNVATGVPPPAGDDYLGFPLMHPAGSLCSFALGCVYNADQLRMDDRAAISRLYPVTADNVSSFAGKQALAATTGRVRGRVRFPDWYGAPGQGMQGVNVVARWVDPATGRASRSVAASSVSGFLFRGNAGNAITGFAPQGGDRYDRWGASDTALHGYFDLAGLEIPTGSTSAAYELSVESVNAAYTGASSVGPYKLRQVALSGAAAPVVVTIVAGSDLQQEIILQGGVAEPADAYEPHSFAEPAGVPGAGHWAASLSGYGDMDWHTFAARASRSFTLDAMARNDAGVVTTNKALPVIGLWAPGATEADPASVSQTYFNTGLTGVTRMQATFNVAGEYRIGIGDFRGDGRPDFLYRARLLYADEVTPTHASVGGDTILKITGTGLAPELKVRIDTTVVPILAFTPEAILVPAPALPEGVKTITLEDPATHATAALIDALTYGSGPGDKLQLLIGDNPFVPVGMQAPNPFRVRVVTADNSTPVAGAAVTFTAPGAAASLLPCNTTICTVASDGAGQAEVWMLVNSAVATTLTASLANGSSVSATVSGLSVPLALRAVPPRLYVGGSSTVSVPLVARVFGGGVPLAGRAVNFEVMLGSALLSAAQASTDSRGEAATTLTAVELTSEVRVSACVGIAPDIACDTFYVYPASTGVQLVKTASDEQYVNPGQRFAPVIVRVLDGSQPPNAVTGVPVTFRVTVFRAQGDGERSLNGEVLTGNYTHAPALATSETAVYSDAGGQARLSLQFPAAWGALRVIVEASVSGGAATTFDLHTWAHAISVTTGTAQLSTASPGRRRGSSPRTYPPSRLPSCTRAGCSEASAPSGPRRGNKAFWMEY